MEGMTYAQLAQEWHSGSDSIIARTSGSTGIPKQISLPKKLVRTSALRTIDFFHLDSDSHVHSCISPEFIGGKMMYVRADICGCRFTYEQPTNRPLRTLPPDTHISLVAVVPSQMRYIMDHLDTMPRVDYYLIGGSALSPELQRDIHDSGITAYESYGMTETSSHIALRRVCCPELPFAPLHGIEVGSDERGCLTIDQKEFGFIVTNDIVQFDTDGNFRILGRADHVIVTGGKKVHPAQLERSISHLFPDCDICVTSRPDPLWTNRVILLVESNEDIDTDRLRDEIARIVPSYCIPKEIIKVERLSRTASGKIIRSPLP